MAVRGQRRSAELWPSEDWAELKVLMTAPPEHWGTIDPLTEEGESMWLPLLGPTAYLLGRRFLLDARLGRSLTYDFPALAQRHGVAGGVAERGLKRLEMFRLVELSSVGRLYISDPWPVRRER